MLVRCLECDGILPKIISVSETSKPLQGRCIAIPESRQLDVLAGLLERRGAHTVRCPLVSIHDVEDITPVVNWIKQAIDEPFDDLILLTGEGLRRLLAVADQEGLRKEFTSSLSRMRTLTRGPKPAKVLRELGLRPSMQATVATTPGVIARLHEENLAGRRMGVQLYGQDPNQLLQDYLQERGAQCLPVAPYRYANDAEDGQVVNLLQKLIGGEVDAICFTSSPQIRRLLSVAKKQQVEPALRDALTRVLVAAVGPVVAEELRKRELSVDLMPESSWFMKPLVQALVDHWQ